MQGAAELTVVHKFSRSTLATVGRATSAEVDHAIAAAGEAFDATRRLPIHERESILQRLAERLAARRGEFVETLIDEGGKPRKHAEAEVGRAIDTFREAGRRVADLHGEYRSLDLTPRGQGYHAIWRRVPLGPVACITPFNFPLNLAVHKIGPAIAAGCPFVLKPASATPLSALMLGEMIAGTAWPAGAWSILPSRAEDAQRLAEDDRIAVVSFTGSAEVGWALKARAGRKRVVLELGGNAAAIVHGDADLADAAKRCAVGGFAQAGQSCISVQRILVQRAVYEEFRRCLLEATAAMKVGDPSRPDVDVGPMISESDARRAEQWVNEAVTGGARLLCGGRREGSVVWPTVLENARPADRVNRCEVFGPVVTLATYDTFDEALRQANASEYGLQAGVFTRDLGRAWQAFDALDVGGVMINEAPTFRADHLPYGGMKRSGQGREGVRFAMEDYTEIKTLVMRGSG